MRTSLFLAFLLAGFTSQNSWGNGQCTRQQFEQLQRAGFAYSDWTQLHGSYSRFKQCDDGGEVSESYSESVARLFVDHWDKLHELAGLAGKHKGFKKFVFRHISASSDGDDLKKIAQLADTNCPDDLRKLCGQISSKAKAASQELSQALQKGGS